MSVRRRPDVGPRVVEVAWGNGDRWYGHGPRPRALLKAAVSRYVKGRRSR